MLTQPHFSDPFSNEDTEPLITRDAQDHLGQFVSKQPLADYGSAELITDQPSACGGAAWKERVEFVYRYIISPMAGINGYAGGRNAAETFCHVPSSVSWLCGIGGWLGFASGFSQASLPHTAQNKMIALCSGLNSLVGAIPSAALSVESMAELRDSTNFIQGYAFRWFDYAFAGMNGISNFVLGVDEGHTWGLRVTDFFKRLLDMPVHLLRPNNVRERLPEISATQKAIMIFCGLIVAYCAFTSIIGYTPEVVVLVAKFAPPAIAQACAWLANLAEWMFQTNMMFTQDPAKACLWNFANPIPENWRENKTVAAMSVGVGLVSGLAMASFTFSATSVPVLAYVFAATAWTGGFWTAVKPTYACFSDPCKIIKSLYNCCIAPCCTCFKESGKMMITGCECCMAPCCCH